MCMFIAWYPLEFSRLHNLCPWYWNSLMGSHLLWGEFWAFSAANAIHKSPFFVSPGTHHCWVDRGGMIWEACPTPLRMAAVWLEHRSPIHVLTRLSIAELQWSDGNWLPLGHVLPSWIYAKGNNVISYGYCMGKTTFESLQRWASKFAENIRGKFWASHNHVHTKKKPNVIHVLQRKTHGSVWTLLRSKQPWAMSHTYKVADVIHECYAWEMHILSFCNIGSGQFTVLS